MAEINVKDGVAVKSGSGRSTSRGSSNRGSAGSSEPPTEGMLTFTGVLDRILFKSDNSAWAIALIKADDQYVQTLNVVKPAPKTPQRFADNPKVIKCVGNFATTTLGTSMEITGFWEEAKKFGVQFTVKGCRLVEGIIGANTTRESVVKLLTTFPNVGPATAEKILNVFLQDPVPNRALVEDLNNGGIRVATVVPSPEMLEGIVSGWRSLAQQANVLAFLYDLEFGSALAQRIIEHYQTTKSWNGDMIIAEISANPYRLCDDVHGVGFLTADKAALALKVPLDSPFRKIACLSYILEEASNNGHTLLLRSEVYTAILEKIGQPMLPVISDAAAERLIIENRERIGKGERDILVLYPEDPDLRKKFVILVAKGLRQYYIGLRRLVEAELTIADRVDLMLHPEDGVELESSLTSEIADGSQSETETEDTHAAE